MLLSAISHFGQVSDYRSSVGFVEPNPVIGSHPLDRRFPCVLWQGTRLPERVTSDAIAEGQRAPAAQERKARLGELAVSDVLETGFWKRGGASELPERERQ